MNTTIEKLIQDYECAVSKIILYCVTELPFSLGIKKTISLLKGSKSTFIIDHKLHNLATYSILPTFTREQLRTIIETLIKVELFDVEFVSEYKNMPVLNITTKGRDFIAGRYEANVKFLEDFVDRSIPEFDDFEKALFDKLRELRRDIAQQRDIPAFMICGDTTLRELTKQKPIDTTTLFSVCGIGDKFVQNYGDKFIEAITRHMNNE
jgi:ATP-dependent DNA helicase RecQ